MICFTGDMEWINGVRNARCHRHRAGPPEHQVFFKSPGFVLETRMQSRRIKKSYRNVTGMFPTPDQTMLQGESMLELDNLILRADHPDVLRLHVQPVTLKYLRGNRYYPYTPDTLTEWRAVPCQQQRPPLLEEVKPFRELELKADELAPKFEAARAYALQQGWTFAVITEREIRGVPLANAKIMMRYRRPSSQLIPELAEPLLERVDHMKIVSIDELIRTARLSDEGQTLRQIWILLARHRLHADRALPFSRETMISPGRVEAALPAPFQLVTS